MEGPPSSMENTNSWSRILAAEPVAAKPDVSEIKGTCRNPLPAKGESLGSCFGFWRVPFETSTIERHNPKLTGTLFSRFSLHRGTAPQEDQVSSWPHVAIFSGACGIVCRLWGSLVVFASVRPREPSWSPLSLGWG